MKGLFITLEGMDGVGKTTQLRKLEKYLTEKGYQIIVTREPGGTVISEKIRDIILDENHKEMDDVAEVFLYAAARSQHVAQVIKPAVLQGKIVLCDRFVDSSIAYQGFGRQLGMEFIEKINQPALHGIEPDLTLYFHLDFLSWIERLSGRSDRRDRLEQEDISFHRRVYEGYKALLKKYPERIKKIDAHWDVERVFEQVKNCFDCLLECHK